MERRHRRKRHRDGARARRGRGRHRLSRRAGDRRPAADPEAAAAVTAGARGRGVRDLRRPAVGAGRPDRRPGSRRRPREAVRAGLLQRARGRFGRGPLLGQHHAVPAHRRPHHRRAPGGRGNAAGDGPLGVRPDPRRTPGLFPGPQRRRRLRHADAGVASGAHGPRSDRHRPDRHRPRVRTAGAAAHGPGDQPRRPTACRARRRQLRRGRAPRRRVRHREHPRRQDGGARGRRERAGRRSRGPREGWRHRRNGRGRGHRPHPAGQPPQRRRRHRVRSDRLRASRPRGGPGARRARQGARQTRPRGRRKHAARGAGALRRRGPDRRHRRGPARQPLRAAFGAGDQGFEDHPAARRPRVRTRLDRHPHPGPDPGQAGGRRRGAEPAPSPGAARRHLRRAPLGRLAAGCLVGQGHQRLGDLDRPAEDAPCPDRRHHGVGQVRQRQRDPQLDPAARVAERGATGAGRSQARRAEPLREHPAPADAGGDLAPPGRQRVGQPDRRDGEPLRGDGGGPLTQPRRAEPGARAGGRAAAAAHPLRDR